mmetsp:Transcript_3619/g.5363  ORF Transcript_3619/g.5363 Transcript_3619/m.5363 type:complete len:1021 (-) Transcript_3619:676-3738(-)
MSLQLGHAVETLLQAFQSLPNLAEIQVHWQRAARLFVAFSDEIGAPASSPLPKAPLICSPELPTRQLMAETQAVLSTLCSHHSLLTELADRLLVSLQCAWTTERQKNEILSAFLLTVQRAGPQGPAIHPLVTCIPFQVPEPRLVRSLFRHTGTALRRHTAVQLWRAGNPGTSRVTVVIGPCNTGKQWVPEAMYPGSRWTKRWYRIHDVPQFLTAFARSVPLIGTYPSDTPVVHVFVAEHASFSEREALALRLQTVPDMKALVLARYVPKEKDAVQNPPASLASPFTTLRFLYLPSETLYDLVADELLTQLEATFHSAAPGFVRTHLQAQKEFWTTLVGKAAGLLSFCQYLRTGGGGLYSNWSKAIDNGQPESELVRELAFVFDQLGYAKAWNRTLKISDLQLALTEDRSKLFEQNRTAEQRVQQIEPLCRQLLDVLADAPRLLFASGDPVADAVQKLDRMVWTDAKLSDLDLKALQLTAVLDFQTVMQLQARRSDSDAVKAVEAAAKRAAVHLHSTTLPALYRESAVSAVQHMDVAIALETLEDFAARIAKSRSPHSSEQAKVSHVKRRCFQRFFLEFLKCRSKTKREEEDEEGEEVVPLSVCVAALNHARDAIWKSVQYKKLVHQFDFAQELLALASLTDRAKPKLQQRAATVAKNHLLEMLPSLFMADCHRLDYDTSALQLLDTEKSKEDEENDWKSLLNSSDAGQETCPAEPGKDCSVDPVLVSRTAAVSPPASTPEPDTPLPPDNPRSPHQRLKSELQLSAQDLIIGSPQPTSGRQETERLQTPTKKSPDPLPRRLEGRSRQHAKWYPYDLNRFVCQLDADAQGVARAGRDSREIMSFHKFPVAKGKVLKDRLNQLTSVESWEKEAMTWLSVLSVFARDIFPGVISAVCYGVEQRYDVTSVLFWRHVLDEAYLRFRIRVVPPKSSSGNQYPRSKSQKAESGPNGPGVANSTEFQNEHQRRTEATARETAESEQNSDEDEGEGDEERGEKGHEDVENSDPFPPHPMAAEQTKKRKKK